MNKPKIKVLKKVESYTIYDTPFLDCDSEKTGKKGCVEIVDGVYWFKGDLPQYVLNIMAKIIEKRGVKYYYNNDSYFNIQRTPLSMLSDLMVGKTE